MNTTNQSIIVENAVIIDTFVFITELRMFARSVMVLQFVNITESEVNAKNVEVAKCVSTTR